MGTKNNPGEFDCFAKAEPDEPVFVLLGRDPHAPMLVELWAALRSVRTLSLTSNDREQRKVAEARACAEAMKAWKTLHPDIGPPVLKNPLQPDNLQKLL